MQNKKELEFLLDNDGHRHAKIVYGKQIWDIGIVLDVFLTLDSRYRTIYRRYELISSVYFKHYIHTSNI